MKKCRKCGLEKSFDEFYKQKGGLHNLTAECKECRKARTAQYTQSHLREKHLSDQNYYKKNIDKKREKQKRWYDEKGKQYQRDYRARKKNLENGVT